MNAEDRGQSVVVAGVGNIGSQLVPHLGRMPSVGRVVLIDHDTYSKANVRAQHISAAEVGRKKALVQAERLLSINPSLVVEPITRAVEEVPLGRLRADAIVCCLDSWQARQYVNEAAVHLCLSWIDAGIAVLPGGSKLARATTYSPGADAACMECASYDGDQNREGSYPCLGGTVEAPSTGSPVYLGALAASLQAFACERVLAGESDGVRQVIVDAQFNTITETRYQRNVDCLLEDHGAWSLSPLRKSVGDMAVEELFALGGGTADVAVAIEWGRLELGARCGTCGWNTCGLRLRRLLPIDWGRCMHCRGRMLAVGDDVMEEATLEKLSEAARSLSLRGVGIETGDILRITGPQGVSRFEVQGERRAAG